ncbi:serine--tRNA ligase [Perlabentimonas gracilis]|uniref:serine--tRNA ligase n=1 Tax=Perlabentimonas gracilis TaxID=2715279 RepID=UPI00140B8A0E|nr:serine--tRNA ligase [Perlabentimonas gracilis]NHB67864.1 serine--tRNA ligase [Perlabentimonas gracilis]
MLTLKQIHENKEEVIARLLTKNFDAKEFVEKVIDLDGERKSLQGKLDAMLAEQNALSKEIGIMFKQGKAGDAETAKQRVSSLKEESKQLSQHMVEVEKELADTLVKIPNLPHPSVPHGKTADDNVEVRAGGSVPSLHKNAKPHWELAKDFDIIDFELGVKITGSGFPVYKGKGAKLQRALINFFLEENIAAGYREFMPPLMVNEDSAYGTGQLPDKDGQMYHAVADNFYLIPTAEVPVTNIFRDVILNASDFPIKLTAYTPCFRREAGSYGKDVRGLNRLHQFDKVEIVQVQHPDKSYQSLDEMVAHVEGILKKLELPYRIVRLCGGDMSFTSALTYDFEVYSAAQEKWLEVSSVSNFESFQANRLKLRYREEGEKRNLLAHTLNGSSLALPRILAALLENYQDESGINIPKVLQPFCGFERI